jgi:hypothetical protein
VDGGGAKKKDRAFEGSVLQVFPTAPERAAEGVEGRVGSLQ